MDPRTLFPRAFALSALCCVLLLAGCSKDDVIDVPQPHVPQGPYVPAPAKDGRAVVAYVTYYGRSLPDPRIVTHINYAFAEIYVSGGKYTGFRLQGREERFNSVVALKKQNPRIKILLSFNNMQENNDHVSKEGFSVMAANGEERKKFAEDCRRFCLEKGIDGIDIDWEFPGLSWSGMAVDKYNDVANHVLLMRQLRETLGKDLLLTYAGYVTDRQFLNGGGSRYIDIAKVDPYVDYVNIMTYDMDAGERPHNALVCPSAFSDVSRACRSYLSAGVSPGKLVVGIPFYGRVAFSGKPSAISYRTLQSDARYHPDNWNNDASVPFVTCEGRVYCYYDNPRSIGVKAKWALDRHMFGLMYWENDLDDDRSTLRRAVWDSVMGQPD